MKTTTNNTTVADKLTSIKSTSPILQMAQQTPVKSEAVTALVSSGHWYDWFVAHPYLTVLGGLTVVYAGLMIAYYFIGPPLVYQMAMYIDSVTNGIIGGILWFFPSLKSYFYQSVERPIVPVKRQPGLKDLVDLGKKEITPKNNVYSKNSEFSVEKVVMDVSKLSPQEQLDYYLTIDDYFIETCRNFPDAKQLLVDAYDPKTGIFTFSPEVNERLAEDLDLRVALDNTISYISSGEEFVIDVPNEQLGLPLPLFIIFPVISYGYSYYQLNRLNRYISKLIKDKQDPAK